MRRWTRNADPRRRQLERALAESPGDVELQHAVLMSRVRSGDLPPLAADRLIPGRPVQPWQWVPASYVLLEAERIGRQTEWNQGRVEIEWVTEGEALAMAGFAAPPWPSETEDEDTARDFEILPAFGLDPERMLISPRHSFTSHYRRASAHNYFNPARYSRTYVGARQADMEQVEILAGLNPNNVPTPKVGTQEYRDFILSIFPPRWVPNLGHVEAATLKRKNDLHVYLDAEDGEPGESDPASYDGCCPDVYDTQLLLFASPQTRSRGRRRKKLYGDVDYNAIRYLAPRGPYLDVRLIRRVRIMRRRGKKLARWV